MLFLAFYGYVNENIISLSMEIFYLLKQASATFKIVFKGS